MGPTVQSPNNELGMNPYVECLASRDSVLRFYNNMYTIVRETVKKLLQKTYSNFVSIFVFRQIDRRGTAGQFLSCEFPSRYSDYYMKWNYGFYGPTKWQRYLDLFRSFTPLFLHTNKSVGWRQILKVVFWYGLQIEYEIPARPTLLVLYASHWDKICPQKVSVNVKFKEDSNSVSLYLMLMCLSIIK